MFERSTFPEKVKVASSVEPEPSALSVQVAPWSMYDPVEASTVMLHEPMRVRTGGVVSATFETMTVLCICEVLLLESV